MGHRCPAWARRARAPGHGFAQPARGPRVCRRSARAWLARARRLRVGALRTHARGPGARAHRAFACARGCARPERCLRVRGAGIWAFAVVGGRSARVLTLSERACARVACVGTRVRALPSPPGPFDGLRSGSFPSYFSR